MTEGMYNGQDWATHTVSLLLCNTYSLYGSARELAQEDATGAALGEWVSGWFWADTEEVIGLTDTDRQAIEGTRYNMSRGEFDKVDWRAVAEDLAAE